MATTEDKLAAVRAKMSMSPDEVNAFLGDQRSCRLATISPRGPHITGMTFIWDGDCVWVCSGVRSQRFVDVGRNPRVAAFFDAVAEPLNHTKWVEVLGDAEVVGEVPRLGEPHPQLDRVEELFFAKYGDYVKPIIHDGPEPFGGHAWLKITPSKILSQNAMITDS